MQVLKHKCYLSRNAECLLIKEKDKVRNKAWREKRSWSYLGTRRPWKGKIPTLNYSHIFLSGKEISDVPSPRLHVPRESCPDWGKKWGLKDKKMDSNKILFIHRRRGEKNENRAKSAIEEEGARVHWNNSITIITEVRAYFSFSLKEKDKSRP